MVSNVIRKSGLRRSLFVILLTFIAHRDPLWGLESLRQPPSQYFAVEKDRKIKIQFNTDHQIFNDWPFYFSYTMRGFWDRSGQTKSNPFIDINHHPEILAKFFGNQIVSFEHASNGVDNEPAGPTQRRNRSRSINRFYWQSLWKILPSGSLIFAPRFDAPIITKKSTPYHDYLGTISYVVEWRRHNKVAGFLKYSRGNKGYQFVSQYSLDPLSLFGSNRAAKTQLFMEYFNGYGDYLLDFDQKRIVYRIGLRLVR